MKVARLRHPLRTTALALLVLAVLAAVVVGMWRPWSPPSAAAPIAVAADASPVVAPAPLELPEHPRVLVFGDSWTYGAAATTPTLGYAYVLAELIGGETIVDGVRGSGYLRPGRDGPAFGERIAVLNPSLDPDLVIVQGSVNDRLLIKDGGYREAVTSAWDALATLYPAARIVVLGPAPHELPVGSGTALADAELSALAAARGWWYISPIARDWITEQNYLDVIDVGVGNMHPSTAGHRYLAEKVAEALEEFAAPTVTEAGEAETTPEQ